MCVKTALIGWEYEDLLEIDITEGMFRASRVDIVRLYPYVVIGKVKYFLESPKLEGERKMDQLRTSHIKVGKGDIESDKDFLEYMKILIEDNISDGYPPVTMAEVDRLIKLAEKNV